MDKKYQVFVSSTFRDLETQRRTVIEQILNMRHIPVGMESFNAADDTQWDYIRKRIHQCDYYLVIVAERYGAIEPIANKSYTQLEYEYALSLGKPVIAFLLHEDIRKTWPREHTDFSNMDKIEAFRALCETKMVKHWRNADHLGLLVSNSLNELIETKPGVGWVRGDLYPENTIAEITSLSAENRSLREKIDLLRAKSQSEMTVPSETQHRIKLLQSEFVFLKNRSDQQLIKTNITIYHMFMFLRKKFAIGLSIYSVQYEIKGKILAISDEQFLAANEAIAEMSSHKLIDSLMEPTSGAMSLQTHDKVWYLTEYGKDLAFYADILEGQHEPNREAR